MHSFSSKFFLSAVLVSSLLPGALLAQDAQQPQSNTMQPGAGVQSPAAPAQHAPNPQRQARHMAKQLGLSPDQEGRIEPILANREQQAGSIRADATLSPQDRRAKLQSVRQDADNQINAVLTDAQKQQWQQMKAQRHTQSQGAPSNG